jgi:hypothetical protein
MLTLARPGTTQKTPAIALVKERDGTLSNGALTIKVQSGP